MHASTQLQGRARLAGDAELGGDLLEHELLLLAQRAVQPVVALLLVAVAGRHRLAYAKVTCEIEDRQQKWYSASIDIRVVRGSQPQLFSCSDAELQARGTGDEDSVQ